ncbi:MAG TPA: LLM class F420-dependent oxidoreductase [Aldersonia sp.]
MDIGFGLPVGGSWATPDNVAEIAGRAEELGYATLWTYQRLLVPADAPAGPQYRSVLDPVTVLGFAAAVTSRIRLGTGIVNLPFQSPVLLGKQLTTLDVLSGGRLVAGVGLGWSEEEFVASGVDFARRGARAEEYLAALRAVWGPDPVSFSGEFYTIPSSLIAPKPVQKPHPPLILGGGAPVALRRAGRVGDGWVSSSREDAEALGEKIERVREAAREAGRDPASLRFVCRGVVRVGQRRKALSGSYDEIRADLERIADAGMDEVFVDLNFDPAVGNPDVDPAAAMTRAREVLEALAP